jgi:hypothetical protein
MGLLDSLFNQSPQGGGLLDFLRNNAMNQQFGSGLQSDQAQYGAPMGAMAQMQPMAQPGIQPQPAMPQAPAQPAQPMPQQQPMPQEAAPGGFGAGVNGFISNLHTGPIGALIGGIGSAAGLSDGKTAIARQQANTTANFLRSHGVPEADIAAAVGNGRVPGNPEVLKVLMANNVKEKSDVRPATAEERKAAFGNGTDNGQPLYIDKLTNKPIFGPAQTNVNVSTEKTGQAELAKTGVESYVAAQNAGRDAQKRVAMYDQMEKASQGFTPGASAEVKLAAKRYLKDAGLIKGEDVPDGEIMQMISRQLGIHAQPKGQGAVSNYERELFAKSLPNMTQSPEGLKMAIDISRKLEQHDQKVAEIYRESAKANKGLPNYLEVQEKIAGLGSPLSDSHMAAISGGSAPASPAPSSGAGWTNIGNGVKIRPK